MGRVGRVGRVGVRAAEAEQEGKRRVLQGREGAQRRVSLHLGTQGQF